MGNVFQCQNLSNTLPDYPIDDRLEAGVYHSEKSFVKKSNNTLYENGYDQGYTDGYADGYETGNSNGIKLAYEEGVQNGKIDGAVEGHKRGYNEGYCLGFKDCDAENENYRRKYNDIMNQKEEAHDSDAHMFKGLIDDYLNCYMRLQYGVPEDDALDHQSAMATIRSTMIEKIQLIKKLMLAGYTFNKAWLFVYDDDQMAFMFMDDFMQRPSN